MNPTDQISIDLPLKGEWKFLRPPGHHPFAFDFMKMNPARKKYSRSNVFRFLFGHIPSDQYFCWNQSVFSPIDGEVLQVGTGWEDHQKTNIWKTIKIWYIATYKFRPEEKNGRLDIRPNAGNYVMIKTSKGHIVFLAHFRNGSINVKEGQSVRSGDQIGSVGNSGNSSAPHLHINLFDQMDDPYTAKVLQFVFNKYEELDRNEKWQTRSQSVPGIKSFIKDTDG